ncbi:FusB/FusC family EF-G-binding protein [Enterococcus sp. LJL128]|uniref:FusB/FusC family EF-G-binding protein n=1 Tax=Enterococcus sp. LJL51 TaxID=3416656 RepID=UPI003CF285A4
MNPTIQPYEYNYVKNQAETLINTYTSVNDSGTVKTIQALAIGKINELFPEGQPEVDAFMEKMMNIRITRSRMERYLATLKEQVIPFDPPSNPQLTKLFRKTKKLKIPEWSELDLRDHTYVGWNDPGTQRKFIITHQGDKLVGVSGVLSPEIIKGACAICKTISNVSLFLATTKTASDGTYTKKGNYICHDSDQCNHQLLETEELSAFIKNVQAAK